MTSLMASMVRSGTLTFFWMDISSILDCLDAKAKCYYSRSARVASSDIEATSLGEALAPPPSPPELATLFLVDKLKENIVPHKKKFAEEEQLVNKCELLSPHKQGGRQETTEWGPLCFSRGWHPVWRGCQAEELACMCC